MSTKVGIIAEGPIDYLLIPALLERIARDRASFTWPTMPEDLGEIMRIRKRGHGGVLEAVRRLVAVLEKIPPPDHAFFIILLDRRTRPVYEEIRKLIGGKQQFVLGIAIEEIDAWWLADRRNTLTWLGLNDAVQGAVTYLRKGYKPERDPQPKTTLDELTQISPQLDQRYGHGNTHLAEDFVTHYWREYADLDSIERGCPQGFRPFCRHTMQALNREKTSQGRLL